MEFKNMRDYSHEEFVDLVLNLNEKELLELSKQHGGYPVLFRMSLDERISHIPFIQTGASVIVINNDGEILLQQRADNKQWGLPGGCQELGENLRTTAIRELYEETGISAKEHELILIDTISGEKRRKTYPNGDIVYNNCSLYLYNLKSNETHIKIDTESLDLKFFNINNLPSQLHDDDLIEEYIKFINK